SLQAPSRRRRNKSPWGPPAAPLFEDRVARLDQVDHLRAGAANPDDVVVRVQTEAVALLEFFLVLPLPRRQVGRGDDVERPVVGVEADVGTPERLLQVAVPGDV